MVDEIEGIGAAVTGGLAARAVEPGHGEAGEGDAHAAECANCAMPLIGPHCHYCGQRAHVHRSIGAIAHELIHGVLHLDGKFWRTLPLLAWRPGELTRRFAHGERAKFVSPLGMFLFSVFLMFAIFSAFGLSLSNISIADRADVFSAEAAREDLSERLTNAQARRDRLAERLEAEEADPEESEESRADLRERIAATERRIVNLEEAQTVVETLAGDGESANIDGQSSFQIIGGDIHTGWDRLDKGIEKLNDNPSLALYKLQANGFKFSWLLIPVSVPFVWVLFFWTRRFRLYDHAVFVTYSLAFMSLLVIALTLLGFAGLGNPWISILALFIPPIHIFRQLKGAYRLHWLSALIRTVFLISFCWITAIIFFVLLLGIGALG